MYEPIVENALRQAAANLTPSETDGEVLKQRIQDFRRLLSESAWPYMLEPNEILLGGAHARDTALVDQFFDVHLYWVLSIEQSTSAADHLKQLATMLQAVHGQRFRAIRVTSRAVEIDCEPNTCFSLVPAIKHAVEIPGDENPQSVPCLLVPSSTGWKPMARPEQLAIMTTQANMRANGFLRPIIRMVKRWNREHGMPLEPTWLEIMCHGAFPKAPHSLVMAFAEVFRHLARAVGEPCPDPTGIGPRLDEGLAPERRHHLKLLLRGTADLVEQARVAAEKDYVQQAHYLFRRVLGTAYPQEPVEARPVIVTLDVFPGLALETLKDAAGIRQTPVVLSMQSAMAPGEIVSREIWLQLGQRVAHLAERVHALSKKDEPPFQLFISGRAPLSLFVQLGFELSSWIGEQVFINNQRILGNFHAVPLHSPLTDDTPTCFDVVRGMRVGDPSAKRGRVAVFISFVHGHRPPPMNEIQAFFQSENEEFAGLVEIRSDRGLVLDENTTSRALLELKQLFAQLRGAYPASTGIALFVAGPAQLAYITGLALDPNLVGSILVADYQPEHGYVLALRLPWRGGTTPTQQARLRVQSLEVQSFRGITQAHLDFGEFLTVLIGTNGSGKTSILDALALMLAPLGEALLDKAAQRRIEMDDIAVGHSSARCAIRVSLDDVQLSWWQEQKQNERIGAAPGFDEWSNEQIKKWHEIIRDDEQASLPLTVYYSIRRGEIEIPERLRKRVESEHDRIAATYDASLEKGAADFRTFFEWFRNREDDENAERRDNVQFEDPQLAAVRRAIERLLPGFRNPRIRRSPLRLVVTKDDIELSVHQLSDGERSLLALAGDLARRMSEAYPRSNDPLMGGAVILIDEIDLHLHPAWQQRVVEDLRRTFPNCQFVVTTHSPHVLSTVAMEDIRVLHILDKVVQVETPQWQTRGTESAAILAVVMGVDPSPKIREVEMLRDYRALIQEGKHQNEEAVRLRRELDAHFGARHPLMVDCDRLVRFTSFRNERARTTTQG
ncbi:MAG TPA: AAA family ATPase [Polyangium sp.]|nr:AAA family ATPase [Polyangium sp.]